MGATMADGSALQLPGVQGMQPLNAEQRWASVERRLIARSHREGACLLWDGRLTYSGYGHISIRNQNENAHRAAYKLWVGPIPSGLEIDHLCNVRNCIEPTHLEAVTHAENVRRRYAREVECVNGHDLATYAYRPPHGRRTCRECRREARLRARAKRLLQESA